MGENRVIRSCSSCLLTPSAEQLLTRLEADLRASRGDDGTWAADACPACGCTTVIRDDLEGWSFGDTGWSFEPDSGEPDVGRPPAAARALAPEWLSLSEFAYLTGRSLEDVTAQLEAGRLDHVSLLGEDRLGVLIRAQDPASEGTPSTPRVRRPRRRRRSDGLGVTTLVLVGALGLLFGGASWWTSRTPAPPERTAAPGTTISSPVWTSDPGGAAMTRPNPSPTPNQSHGGGSTNDPKADPSPSAAALASVPAETGSDVTVGPVEFVSREGWVSAAVWITNETGRWLPASEVTFLVLDTSGATVGSGYGIVDLAPGEEAVVVVEGIELGPEPPAIGSVRAELDAAELRAPERLDGSLFVDDAQVRGSSVTGHVVNTGPARDVVRVDCAISSSSGQLSAVAIALVQPVAADGSATFDATIADAVGAPGSVVCSAT